MEKEEAVLDFESALAEAKLSGKPYRIERNFTQGSTVVYLTEKEVADNVQAGQEELQKKAAWLQKQETARAKLLALGLTPEDIKAALSL